MYIFFINVLCSASRKESLRITKNGLRDHGEQWNMRETHFDKRFIKYGARKRLVWGREDPLSTVYAVEKDLPPSLSADIPFL